VADRGRGTPGTRRKGRAVRRYSAAPVLAGLKDFQRATVHHVMDRFFGADPTRRFLVADETGLGKSVVARGIIAETLQRLQDDDRVERVDVIYVCSNQDIAAQNLARLKVSAEESITLSSRLTMLARHSAALAAANATAGKPLNLVAFTPGTSFDKGWRTGKGEERALLYLLLRQAGRWDGWRERAAVRAVQATIRDPNRFYDVIVRLDADLDGTIDEVISGEFLRDAADGGLLDQFSVLLDDIGRRHSLPSTLRQRAYDLIGQLRSILARAGVRTLEPDLVILDEFQRFRHLLDVEQGGESAELARHLFDYGQARVLLLSATPYKPFTLAEEAARGEDHHRDFRDVLRFLCADQQWNTDVSEAFQAYREATVRGLPCEEPRARLRSLLMRVMCRTERPVAGSDGMLDERIVTVAALREDDVRGYVALRHAAAAVNAPATVEYWKSAPYFLNFTEGYKLGQHLRSALLDGRGDELAPLLDVAQLLDTDALQRYAPIDLGNARLRHLAADTVERGWWRLLWIPPSMPHYALTEPFAEAARQGMTKRLLFSSWNATPTAVAGLLSYDAERRIVGDRLRRNDPAERRRVTARLDYRLDGDRPAAMSTLALFWPHPRLAAACDPLAIARRRPKELVSLATMHDDVRDALVRATPDHLWAAQHAGEGTAWEALFGWPGAALPDGLPVDDALETLSGSGADETESGDTGKGLDRHVEQALARAGGPGPVAKDGSPATSLRSWPRSACTDPPTSPGAHSAG